MSRRRTHTPNPLPRVPVHKKYTKLNSFLESLQTVSDRQLIHKYDLIFFLTFVIRLTGSFYTSFRVFACLPDLREGRESQKET